MKITLISDLHGNLPPVEPTDLLLIGGDLCPTVDHSIGFQRLWLTTNFKNWVTKLKAKKVITIAGNHDFIFEDERPDIGCEFLHDSMTEVNGLKIYGTPWQPPFFDWAFNLRNLSLRRSGI